MAVPGELAWYSEIEKSACKVLAAHHPDVPNLGDVKAIDWATVPHVDILTGGYPCQPFSNAGMRRGKNDERHLWPYVRNAISAIRPRLAILENVRGHLSMGLSEVIGDLASMGYDARWGLVRASDAGAPHQRARVFIVAYPQGDPSDGRSVGHNFRNVSAARQHDQRTIRGIHSPSTDTSSERHGGGQNHRMVGRLDTAHEASPRERQWTRQEPAYRSNANDVDWGKYKKAVNRWEALSRHAPCPTFSDKDGRARLSPVFVEWMMGLPEGHVTGHGLSVAQELKMLGNGVVPQQAALALKLLGVTA